MKDIEKEIRNRISNAGFNAEYRGSKFTQEDAEQIKNDVYIEFGVIPAPKPDVHMWFVNLDPVLRAHYIRHCLPEYTPEQWRHIPLEEIKKLKEKLI